MSRKKKIEEIDEKILSLRSEHRKAVQKYEKLCEKRCSLILEEHGLKFGDKVWASVGDTNKLCKCKLCFDYLRNAPKSLNTEFYIYLRPYTKEGNLEDKRYIVFTYQLSHLEKVGG